MGGGVGAVARVGRGAAHRTRGVGVDGLPTVAVRAGQLLGHGASRAHGAVTRSGVSKVSFLFVSLSVTTIRSTNSPGRLRPTVPESLTEVASRTSSGFSVWA